MLYICPGQTYRRVIAMNNSLLSSVKMDYSTPKYFFYKLNQIFNFNYDLAADATNHKCMSYFNPKQDSLKQDWSKIPGWCWLNPPYGKTIGDWVAKAMSSSIEGANIVMLIPARTDTTWQHNFVFKASCIIFIKGRLKFGDSKNSAPFPSQLAIFGQLLDEHIFKLKKLDLGYMIL